MRVLHRFAGGKDGYEPFGQLLEKGGVLYGTACSCRTNGTTVFGTIFRIDKDGSSYRILHTFRGTPAGDGAYPRSNLVSINGYLFGTTYSGGENESGIVFKIKPDGSHYSVLYNFADAYSGRDGATPVGNLAVIGGKIYGTTWRGGGADCGNAGGLPGCGTIFSIDTAGVEHVLYHFKAGNDGRYPMGGVIELNGLLYGTTYNAGGPACNNFGCGTVFSATLSGKERIIHRFDLTDGANPDSNIIAVDGTLLGTTSAGGTGGPGGNNGVVFSMLPSGVETVLYNFAGPSDNDGSEPNAVAVMNGTVYGTTQLGGAPYAYCGNGCGTVFAIGR